MRRRRRKKNFRLIYIIMLILVLGVWGKNLNKLNFFHRNTARAISVVDGLKMMGENDPLNKEINKKIMEEKQRKKEEERKKEEIENNAEKDNGKKIAYLTFDDGPSVKATPIVLDQLKKFNVKATFFVVGNMVKENPDILKRIYDEGHQIGNHSYSHNYSYLYKNAKNFMNDIYKTEQLIKDVVGEDFDSKIIRFPGGSFEKRKNPMKKAASDAGYTYIDWNALNGDAEGVSFSETHLINRLKETVGGKRKVVVLMHDTDQKVTTATSLEKSIKFLLDEGYEFERLEKNFSWE